MKIDPTVKSTLESLKFDIENDIKNLENERNSTSDTGAILLVIHALNGVIEKINNILEYEP